MRGELARGHTSLNLEEANTISVCRICISYTNLIQDIIDLQEITYFKVGHC